MLGLGSLASSCGWTSSRSGAPTTSGLVVADRRSSVANPIGSLVTKWGADPFARGSYSFLAAGSDVEDRRRLAEPSDRLFFAGEATERDHPATVHGAFLSGERAAEEILSVEPASVIVVGAGASGLSAARVLADAQTEVRVVEGRDRIGGRVWTDSTLGIPLDLGASWIHGVSGNPLTALADSVGAIRSATDYESRVVFDADGGIVEPDDLPGDFEEVTSIEHEFGASTVELSPEALNEGEEFGGGDAILPEGYLAIIETLVQGFDISTGVVVERVETTSDAVTLGTTDGELVADVVLITVPLGVLKSGSIEFVPPLGPERQGAIDRLGMGLLDKVYLQFDEIFWEPDIDLLGYVGPDRGFFAEWLNIAKYTGEPILLGFNAAEAAETLEARTDDEIVAEAMRALRNMYEAN